MLRVSIGICAHNEEKTIGLLLHKLLNQMLNKIKIDEIIIVSSSTDRTNDIVLEYADIDDRIILIRQKRREGKASAVNEFLRNATRNICVLESADTIPLKDTIERLCLPFYDRSVGMTGGRPIPVNDRNKFMGYVGDLLWELHHRISLKYPKMGELVAFRKVIDEIPKDISVDEAWIEAEIRRRGYRVIYVPDAICYNKSPENIKDFIKQRRRIYAGHLDLKNRLGYSVSTMDTCTVVKELIKLLRPKPREIMFAIGAIALEGIGRILGYYDYYVRGENHAVWEMAESTKEVLVNEVD